MKESCSTSPRSRSRNCRQRPDRRRIQGATLTPGGQPVIKFHTGSSLLRTARRSRTPPARACPALSHASARRWWSAHLRVKTYGCHWHVPGRSSAARMCSPSARRWPPARSGPGGPPRSGRSVCASGQRRTPVSHHWQDCQALGLLTRSTAAQRRASRRWPGRSGSRPGSGRQRWPHSGRTTALNGATCCASLSSIAPVHQPYGLVRDVHASLYGSDVRAW